MPLILFLAVLLCASPSFAIPLAFQFDSLLNDGTTITGSLSYESEQSPLAVNVRNLTGNQVYALDSYEVVIHPQYELLPQMIAYSQDNPLTTAEFCAGNCVFSAGNVTSLRFLDGLHTLQLIFAATPDLTTFGAFHPGSTLRSINADGSFNSLYVIQSGTMTAANVPEPSSWMLLAGGISALVLWRKRRS